MADNDLKKSSEKSLTSGLDLLDTYTRQIRDMALELQYGELTVCFKIREGHVKEAHKLQEAVKLRPF